VCPEDCETVENVESEEFTVTNPNSGTEWWCKAFFPSDASADNPYPAIVSVPGGHGAGSTMQAEAQALAANGYVVVVFDADGRGSTTGDEDDCGAVHQDGLKAVIEAVDARPEVGRIGLQTGSFGITMGAGVLARYPDLPVVFLLDWEGPADRNDTGHCDESDTGHITDEECDDEVFWEHREASTSIMQVQVPYLRMQRARDHAQPDNLHAILMINNATSTEHGGNGVSPWTRVNGGENTLNAVYTEGSPPLYYPNNLNTEELKVQFFEELFALD